MAFNRYTARSVTSGSVQSVKTFSATTTIIGITLCNRTASAIKVACALHDGTATTYIVGGPTIATMGADIPAGGSLVVVGGEQKLVALNGDQLQIETNTASSVDVIISVLE